MTITQGALFLAFLRIGLSGFGGVLPFARHELVEREKWLTPAEFNEIVGLCQVLPGGNVINVASILGHRFAGWQGAVAATAGLVLPPSLLAMAIAAAVGAAAAQYAPVRAAVVGLAVAATGLVVATAVKMAMPIARDPRAIGLALLVCLCVAVLRLPLIAVLAAAIPLAWMVMRRP